ncbi:pyridoxamine 5'-phosphate oxidase family protein [Nocardia sp. NPDC057663]|uniref:pyridoxamine 5'-phosphate oxidase family protein n=1 Tax=Nocardia sp. NPDC057663 TaxID=3346201 RepID=UPI00366D66B9
MNDTEPDRRIVDLDRATALGLLASAPFGRIVFMRDALPAVRPVNHLVEHDDTVIVRTGVTSKLTTAVGGNSVVVVTYEADDIDPIDRLGWSVTVTGLARPVTDADRIARYERMLTPWVDKTMDSVIEIETTIVTGIRLIDCGRTNHHNAPRSDTT